MIPLELDHSRTVENVRGVYGGYRLKRAPSDTFLDEIIRTIDGPTVFDFNGNGGEVTAGLSYRFEVEFTV